MRGRLILSARALLKLRDLLGTGEDEPSEEWLVATIEHQTFTTCTTCKSKRPEFCLRCIHHASERVRKVIKARIDAHETRLAIQARTNENRTIIENAREAINKDGRDNKPSS